MSKFKNFSVIEVGDVFTRIDKNGKVWKAEVINRTEYFVDVKKTQPYQRRVGNEYSSWYEDAEPTFERCMLYRQHEEIEVKVERVGFKGKYMAKEYKLVPTARYYIACKEDYSKHWKYDRPYELVKYGDGVEDHIEDAEEGFKCFYNYCKET